MDQSRGPVLATTAYVAVLVAVLCVLWWPPSITATELAAWVQAIGSIAAIIATAAVVWWQEKRRREDIRIERLKRRTDQLESLCAMARRLVDLASAVEDTYTYFFCDYSEAGFADLARAFAEVPVHEARSYSVAGAILALRHESSVVRDLAKGMADYHLRTSYTPGGDLGSATAFEELRNALGKANDALCVLEARLAKVDAKLPLSERGVISTPWKSEEPR